MITEKDFLLKYNISEENYAIAGFLWKDLKEIYDNYKEYQSELETSADYLVRVLHKVKQIHSIRYRLKDPEHLIEKIIRKKIENPGRAITKENYKKEVTDLIGIRLIHLYKKDWLPIHDFLVKTWDILEEPIAYYREGDVFNEEYYQQYNCIPKKHQAGYRSVHYLIKHIASKTAIHIAEFQVRTLFEEGWSEIDHHIRYPYNLNNPMTNQCLHVFNGFAQNADEMGSYIALLKESEDSLRETKNIKADISSNTQESKDVEQSLLTDHPTSNESLSLGEMISAWNSITKMYTPLSQAMKTTSALSKICEDQQKMMKTLAMFGKMNSMK